MEERKRFITINQHYKNIPVEREFNCKCCNRRVVVIEAKDKRCVFCSQVCEKRYWKHRDKYECDLKKRGRETSHLRIHSARDIAIQEWKYKNDYF